jgi:hypothetical protein
VNSFGLNQGETGLLLSPALKIARVTAPIYPFILLMNKIFLPDLRDQPSTFEPGPTAFSSSRFALNCCQRTILVVRFFTHQ